MNTTAAYRTVIANRATAARFNNLGNLLYDEATCKRDVYAALDCWGLAAQLNARADSKVIALASRKTRKRS